MSACMCPCGCGRPGRTRQGWAARGCSLRAMPTTERAARAKAWSDAHPDHMREMGRRGQRVHRPKRVTDLLDKWGAIAQTKGPSYALLEAYRRGYVSGFGAGQQTRKG